MEIFNLFHGETDVGPDGSEPPGYEQTRAARVGKAIGATQMGMSIYELPTGQAVCPYHFEWSRARVPAPSCELEDHLGRG